MNRPSLKRRRLSLRWSDQNGGDPLEGMASFFDLGVVFAVGLMVASLAAARAEREELEEWSPVRDLAQGGEEAEGQGVRLGTAYQLNSGEIIYVPDRTD